jgi:hypothetical protein
MSKFDRAVLYATFILLLALAVWIVMAPVSYYSESSIIIRKAGSELDRLLSLAGSPMAEVETEVETRNGLYFETSDGKRYFLVVEGDVLTAVRPIK